MERSVNDDDDDDDDNDDNDGNATMTMMMIDDDDIYCAPTGTYLQNYLALDYRIYNIPWEK